MKKEDILRLPPDTDIIVFATENENKMVEIREIMKDIPAKLFSLRDIGIKAEAEETGSTFAENAEIKAVDIWKRLKSDSELSTRRITVMADDSGLCIDALSGAPGVYSARWLGHDTPYEEKNRIVLEKLKDIPFEKRGAAFVCAICAVLPEGRTLHTEGEMRGVIAEEPAGENGFGYDPIFYLPEYKKTSSEIPREEKNRISHRGKALKSMAETLSNNLVK